MSISIQDLNDKFEEFVDSIKKRAKGGIDVTGMSPGDMIVVNDAGETVSGGKAGNMAFRNVYVGADTPGVELGEDGDLFFQINVVNDVTLPALANYTDVAYGNGKWVAVVDGSKYCLVSENGSQWAVIELPVEGRWSNVAYGNGRWVMISFNGLVLTSTDDAHTWVESEPLNPEQTWSRITFAQGKFLASPYTTAEGAMVSMNATSTDGATWNYSVYPRDALFTGVTGGEKGFVAMMPHAGHCMYSPDGVNWTEYEMPTNAVWRDAHYANGAFVAIAGSSSFAAYSSDGKTWSLSELPFTADWQNVVYGDGCWMATSGYTDSIAISINNGRTWKELYTNAPTNWMGIAYGAGRFTLLGFNSQVGAYIDLVDLYADPLLQDGETETPVRPPSTLPPAPGKPPVAKPGGYCKAPSTSMRNLAMWFFTDVDTGTVARWVKSNPEMNVGTVFNPPDGVEEVEIQRTQAGYSARIVAPAEVLGDIQGWRGMYTVELLDDSCRSLQNNPLQIADIDKESGMWYSGSLSLLEPIEDGRRYCLVIY